MPVYLPACLSCLFFSVLSECMSECMSLLITDARMGRAGRRAIVGSGWDVYYYSNNPFFSDMFPDIGMGL